VHAQAWHPGLTLSNRVDWEALVLIHHTTPSQLGVEEVQKMERVDLELPPAR
jgi:hypothetical protein